MDIDEYEREKRNLYAAFSQAVAAILSSAIKRESGFRLQQVNARAKDPTSLRKKLEGRQKSDTATLEDDIKDLSGCRVIFYTNTDVQKFVRSGIMHDNFEIVEVKLHQPGREIEDAKELYTSNHYIVRLGTARLTLPEYAHFEGLRCEVQIQTILNHAWAEMAHDTIYKAPDLSGFGEKALQSVKDRMAKVAKRYLVPAGYEFQKIDSDFKRLVEGKELFDGDALEAIVAAEDNNVRVEALETFANSVLPLYDDVHPEYREIAERLIEAVRVAKDAAPVPIETAFGTIEPKTSSDVLEGVVGVLETYRYVDLDVTFDAICELYELAQTKDDRKALDNLTDKFSRNNLQVWRTHGPAVQGELVKRIEDLRPEARLALAPVIITILRNALNSEVRGSVSSSNALTLQMGAVRASQSLRDIRSSALGLLKEQYGSSDNEDDRRIVLSAMEQGSRLPYNSNYSTELARDVLDTTRALIDFYTEIADAQSFELLQTTEERVHRHYIHHRVLPDFMAKEPQIVEANDGLIAAAIAFREVANSKREFVIYKTLVGFNSVFPPAWESDNFAFEEEKAYREEQVKELLTTVTFETAEEWFAIINRCAQTQSNDLATFPVFGDFLRQLSETKPEIALGYLDKITEDLQQFLPGFIRGLMDSAAKELMRARIDAWIAERRHLGNIAWYLQSAEPFDEALLQRVLEAAVASNDLDAVLNCLIAAQRQFKNNSGQLIETIFLPSLRALAEAKNHNWLRGFWLSWLRNPMLLALEREQAIFVLDTMVDYPDLESNGEYVPAAIAERWPDVVLDFLTKRLELASSENAPDGYDALPFTLHYLNAPLAAAGGQLLDRARIWYDRDPNGFRFDGGRLLYVVFPKFAEPLAARLRAYIESNDRDLIAFALAILSAYEGADEVLDLVKSIIGRFEANDPLVRTARSVMNESGMVRGEYGFAELHTQRKALIRPWLDDPNERIRAFATEQIRELDLRIAHETRSAEADVALRRLEFDEDIVPPAEPAPADGAA